MINENKVMHGSAFITHINRITHKKSPRVRLENKSVCGIVCHAKYALYVCVGGVSVCVCVSVTGFCLQMTQE